MENVYAIILVLILGLGYFAPTIISFGKRNGVFIFLLNLLLGWSLIGWLAAFIWACVEKPERT